MFTLLFAGPAAEVMFLLLTPLLAAALGYFGAYTVHSLFVVIEQTAAGFDRVCWPQEGFVDWFGKLLHFLAVLVFVLMTGGFVFLWVDAQGGKMSAMQASVLGFLLLWLVLPVVLLSSLSGASRFYMLRWEILKGLTRCWAPLLVFYALTALPLLLSLGGLYIAVYGWRDIQAAVLTPGLGDLIVGASFFLGLPVSAILAATTVLHYGRLLGRLGWMLQIADKTEENAEAEAEAAPEAAIASSDPPAAPAKAEPVPVAAAAPHQTAETYPLVDEPPTPAPPLAPPFRWEPGRIPPPPPPRNEWRDHPGRAEPEADLRKEKPEPFIRPRVAALLEPKILFFPWYRTSLWAWAVLIFGFLTLAVLVRLPIGYM
ncbi:hypothetical protein AYO44_08325 [Planctomycetaceae bacterium SCGC AG-212-F19]|nr:hypothetical protein AYO44_08325 [Planctomycetaceae bacterium SCGC AG-212-F19]